MRYRTFLGIASILIWINGVLYLLLPGLSLQILGQTTNAIGLMNTRASGAIAIGLGVFNWMGRKIDAKETQKLIATGNLVTVSLLVIVELHGLLNGAMNPLGWLMFLADLLLSLIFLWFLLKFSRGPSS